MPIYEYQCGACGYQFDKLQKVSDIALTDCPKCTKPELHKLVSAAGFQLKGTGWYVTDFRDKNKDKPTTSATSDNKPASDSSTNSTPTTPSKTDSTSTKE